MFKFKMAARAALVATSVLAPAAAQNSPPDASIDRKTCELVLSAATLQGLVGLDEDSFYQTIEGILGPSLNAAPPHAPQCKDGKQKPILIDAGDGQKKSLVGYYSVGKGPNAPIKTTIGQANVLRALAPRI